HRQLGASVEPERGFGLAAALPGEGSYDRGGRQPGAHGRAGNRARDQHRRMLDRLRWEFGVRDLGEKRSQRAGNGHSTLLPAYTLMYQQFASDNAWHPKLCAALDNGRVVDKRPSIILPARASDNS